MRHRRLGGCRRSHRYARERKVLIGGTRPLGDGVDVFAVGPGHLRAAEQSFCTRPSAVEGADRVFGALILCELAAGNYRRRSSVPPCRWPRRRRAMVPSDLRTAPASGWASAAVLTPSRSSALAPAGSVGVSVPFVGAGDGLGVGFAVGLGVGAKTGAPWAPGRRRLVRRRPKRGQVRRHSRRSGCRCPRRHGRRLRRRRSRGRQP